MLGLADGQDVRDSEYSSGRIRGTFSFRGIWIGVRKRRLSRQAEAALASVAVKVVAMMKRVGVNILKEYCKIGTATIDRPSYAERRSIFGVTPNHARWPVARKTTDPC